MIGMKCTKSTLLLHWTFGFRLHFLRDGHPPTIVNKMRVSAFHRQTWTNRCIRGQPSGRSRPWKDGSACWRKGNLPWATRPSTASPPQCWASSDRPARPTRNQPSSRHTTGWTQAILKWTSNCKQTESWSWDSEIIIRRKQRRENYDSILELLHSKIKWRIRVLASKYVFLI